MAGAGSYRAPAAAAHSDLREKGSRFLAIVEPLAQEVSARGRVKAYRDEYRDASHVCWAWRVGWPPTEGRSDAGEPAGTAGTPMLQVLRGAQLSDVLAVVVRWFGGTKLGKGGLARAYAGAVRKAVENLPIQQHRPVIEMQVSLPLERVGDLKRLVHPPRVMILEESYADEAQVRLAVDTDDVEIVEEALRSFASTVERGGK